MADSQQGRTRTEAHRYTQAQVKEIVQYVAKLNIVGGMFQGEFLGQTTHVDKDGEFLVLTILREDPK